MPRPSSHPPAAAPASLLPGERPALLHELQAHRFSLRVDGQLCVLDYQLDGDGRSVTFTHTGVPVSLRGHGLAGELVEAALAWAREEGLQVVPACSYVRAYMKRHPDTGPLQTH